MYSAPILFCSICSLICFSARGVLQLRKQQSGDQLRRGRTDPDQSYVLGGTGHEHERLIRQAKIFKPFTERLFRNAGVARGQRVLDIGSGVGDVAMLVAEMVGPTGEVVGVERDASTLTKARSRVAEARLRNVSFVATDASQVVSEVNNKPFDAIVGKLILEYLPDPGAVLRSLSKLVRPGGIIVIQDCYWAPLLQLTAAFHYGRSVPHSFIRRLSALAPIWTWSIVFTEPSWVRPYRLRK